MKHKNCTCKEKKCKHKKNSSEKAKDYEGFNFKEDFLC